MLGQIPAVALVDEIEAGNIRALVRHRRQPADRVPAAGAACAPRCATLDVLAVVDVAENPLTELATHVLPATGQLERADITLAELTALRSAACRRPGRSSRPWPIAGRSGGCSRR